jgi:hypothetical protein
MSASVVDRHLHRGRIAGEQPIELGEGVVT